MLKIKSKMNKCEDGYTVELIKYNSKHTNTLEHLVVISNLVENILEYDKDMTITKICKLIKETHKEIIEAKEEE